MKGRLMLCIDNHKEDLFDEFLDIYTQCNGFFILS